MADDNADSKPAVAHKKGKRSNQARFPAARIKKMIQADEDVGKVATATPIVVSKALELFLKNLVDESVKDADSRGSKKVTAYGLKRTVQNTALFDFCSDIVEGVPDPIAGEGDGELDEHGEPKKKKKRAPRKKKDEAGGGAAPAAKAGKKKVKQVKDEDFDDEDEDEEDGSNAPKYDDEDYEG